MPHELSLPVAAALLAAGVALGLWLLGRGLAAGLAALGYHVAHAVSPATAPDQLFPSPPAPAAPEIPVQENENLAGIRVDMLDEFEKEEVEWVAEVLAAPMEHEEIERKEAFQKRDYYRQVSQGRAREKAASGVE